MIFPESNVSSLTPVRMDERSDNSFNSFNSKKTRDDEKNKVLRIYSQCGAPCFLW
jgi:hypothetical protein